MGKTKVHSATVFVESITRNAVGHVVVEASNGGEAQMPFVRFQLPQYMIPDCRLGKSYTLTVEVEDFG